MIYWRGWALAVINKNFIYVGALLNLIGSIGYVIDTLKVRTKPIGVTWSLRTQASMVSFFALLGESVSTTEPRMINIWSKAP